MKPLNQEREEIKSTTDERSGLAMCFWIFPWYPTIVVGFESLWLVWFVADSLDPESLAFVPIVVLVEVAIFLAIPATTIATVYLEMLLLRALGRADLAYKFFLDELSVDPKHTRCPPFERGIARMLLSAVGPRPK